MILHPKIVLTHSCQHCPTLLVPRRFGFAAASWSAALQFRRHGHRSHELKVDQGEAGPCNLGIGSASKFIVVAC